MISTAIILAGGLGTRLKGVIKGVPKPMALIHGRPFLEYLMDFWIDQDISRFILSVGYLNESIIDYFGDSYRTAQISYVHENTPLGTGGGFLMAAKNISEPLYFCDHQSREYIPLDSNLFDRIQNQELKL